MTDITVGNCCWIITYSWICDSLRATYLHTGFLGNHRDIEPPDSISNSEVKSVIADDSVGFPHVKVGHCQDCIGSPVIVKTVTGLFLCLEFKEAEN